jgi:uncharacterized membrane protein
MWIRWPVAFFVAALLTDAAYWRTADPLWTTISGCLLLVGLVMATTSVLAELLRVLSRRGRRGRRRLRPASIHMLGNGLAVLLSVVNFEVHVHDGYSAVVPAGPLLSAAAVLLLLCTDCGRRGFTRHRRIEPVKAGAFTRREA